jgi:hypothetical protein
MSDLQFSETSAIKKSMEIENRAKAGANWFFWIAGLSLANSVLLMSGANLNFPIGLGMTQIVDAIAFEGSVEAQTVGRIMSALVAGMFVYLGIQARKNQPWAFITGLVLYAADGLLFLIVSDWLSIGFHAWGFIGIFAGLKAVNEIIKSQATMPYQATSTPPVSTFHR